MTGLICRSFVLCYTVGSSPCMRELTMLLRHKLSLQKKHPKKFPAIKSIDSILQNLNGTLLYYGIQNQPPETWTPAWNRAKAGVLASSAFPSAELLDQSGGGVMDAANWTAGSSATLTNPSTGILRIARNGVNNPTATEDIFIVDHRYRITGETRSDGNAIPRITHFGGSAFTGTNSTSWQTFDFELDLVGLNVVNFQSQTSIGTEYTEWRNLTITEVNPLNENITSLTIGQPGQGNIQNLAQADGTNDLLSLGAPGVTALDTIFSADPITLFGVNKVSSAGLWTDTNVRTIANFGIDGNNFFKVGSDGVGNLQAQVKSGGSVTRTLNTPMTTTDLFSWELTRNGNNLELFVDKVSVDTDSTGLNAWAGTLNQALCTFFAGSTGGEFFSGFGAYLGMADQVWIQSDINSFHDSLGIG